MKKGLLKSIALSCSAMFIIGMSGLPVYAENTTSKNLTKEEAFQQIYERLAGSIEDIKISARGPAPQLRSYYVDSVQSEKGGFEQLGQYYASTLADHGGKYLYVTTIEIGYGAHNTSLFAGSPMTMAEILPIDTNGDRIVDGFARIWLLDSSFTSGQFTLECYGSAYPNNRMSTYMYIK